MRFLFAAVLVGASVPWLPNGAKADQAGHWTIISVPPAPFVMDLPAPPPPPGPAQRFAADRFSAYARWHGQVQGEAATVHNFLQEREKGNYVTMRFEDKDGRFRVVYSFLRDGPGTLAKYHRHPDFFGETVRWSEAELNAAMDVMIAFLRSEQVRNWSGGTGSASNSAKLRLPFTRAEWDALVARRGFKVPEPVELSFEERSASQINAPLPPRIARGIKLFARSISAIGAVPDIASQARIVLREGCFKVAGGSADGAHVLFPLGQRLFIDPQGYLAFGERPQRGYARVGEKVEVHGTFAPVEEPNIVTPIRNACGPGKVVAITAPTSATAQGAWRRSETNRRTLADLRQMWGLSEKGARAYLTDCMKRQEVCIMSPPPPAMGNCPQGSREQGGVCRNPQGHIRPLPTVLEPYAKL